MGFGLSPLPREAVKGVTTNVCPKGTSYATERQEKWRESFPSQRTSSRFDAPSSPSGRMGAGGCFALLFFASLCLPQSMNSAATPSPKRRPPPAGASPPPSPAPPPSPSPSSNYNSSSSSSSSSRTRGPPPSASPWPSLCSAARASSWV